MPAGWRGCRSPRDTLWPCMNAVDAAPFVERRLRFAAAIGDAIAIIPGAQEVRRNGDVNYEFRQQSDFFFLTGFDEPEAVAVINPADTRDYLIRILDVHRMRMSNGVGDHLMRTWPTSY